MTEKSLNQYESYCHRLGRLISNQTSNKWCFLLLQSVSQPLGLASVQIQCHVEILCHTHVMVSSFQPLSGWSLTVFLFFFLQCFVRRSWLTPSLVPLGQSYKNDQICMESTFEFVEDKRRRPEPDPRCCTTSELMATSRQAKCTVAARSGQSPIYWVSVTGCVCVICCCMQVAARLFHGLFPVWDAQLLQWAFAVVTNNSSCYLPSYGTVCVWRVLWWLLDRQIL